MTNTNLTYNHLVKQQLNNLVTLTTNEQPYGVIIVDNDFIYHKMKSYLFFF